MAGYMAGMLIVVRVVRFVPICCVPLDTFNNLSLGILLSLCCRGFCVACNLDVFNVLM